MSSNTIIVYQHPVHTRADGRTKSDWFNVGEDIIIKEDHERVVFTRPNLDYRGKSSKVRQESANIKAIAWSTNGIDCKQYEFDEEESDEDKEIIYSK